MGDGSEARAARDRGVATRPRAPVSPSGARPPTRGPRCHRRGCCPTDSAGHRRTGTPTRRFGAC
jgi:hypothetical protein